MKKRIFALVFVLLFVHCGFCQIPTNDDIIRQKLNFQSKEATADDYLLALGEKSNFNIIAETTTLPTEADIARANDDTLYALMFQFSNAYGLSWHRLDKTTLIFAPDAHIDEIIPLLADHQAFPLDVIHPNTMGNLTAILDYVRPLLAQKQKAGEKPELRVRFADLPLPLKTHIVSWSVGDNSTIVFPIGVLQVLTDDYWHRVRIKKMPELQSANLFLVEEIVTSAGVARSLWEIPGPVGTIDPLRQQTPNVTLPKPRIAQEKDFEPLWKPWQRATWEKQLGNPKLDVKCQLDGKRVALSEVLKQVSKQCGVPIEAIKPHSEKLLTLRVRDLKARDILGALSRMTGGIWQSKAEGYVLQGEATPLQRALLPSTDFERHRYRNRTDFYAENQKYLISIRDAIQKEAGNLVNMPEGVAWTDLSEELRNELRAEIGANLGNYLLGMQGPIQALLDGALQASIDKITDEDLKGYYFMGLGEQAKGEPKLTLTLTASDGMVIKSQPFRLNAWLNKEN